MIVMSLVAAEVLLVARTAASLQTDSLELQAYSSLSSADMVRPANLSRLQSVLLQTESDLRAIKFQAGPLLYVAPLLGWIPYYGGDISQVAALIDLGIQVASSGSQAVDLYGRTLHAADLSPAPPKSLDLWGLSITLDAFRSERIDLEARLTKAVQAREQIRVEELSAGTARLVSRLDPVLSRAPGFVRVLDVLPDLLGAGTTRRYLIIAQNTDELRATGGFISGAGIIQVRDGGILSVSFADSYAVDDLSKQHPLPPWPLTEYMWAPMWVFRDGNWSPDFPTSAQAMEELFQSDQGVQVDGVIAVNTRAVQRLVGSLGSVELKEYGTLVTQENVLAEIESHYLSPLGPGETGDVWSHRKDYAGDVVRAMVEKSYGGQGEVNPAHVGLALWNCLADKDILIYLNSPKEADAIHDLGWDGAMPQVNGDAVLVVDSNVGFNKADSRVERQLEYEVELQPGGRSHGNLEIRYRNTNSPSPDPCVHGANFTSTYDVMRDDCYWDYVRIYTPRATIPITATTDISPTLDVQETGYTALGGFFELPRGASRLVRYEYWILNGETGSDGVMDYRLNWFKQPGAPPAPVRVTVRLPDSLEIRGVFPDPTSRTNSSVDFELPADRDAAIHVRVGPREWPWRAITALAGVLLGCWFGAIAVRRQRRRARSFGQDEKGHGGAARDAGSEVYAELSNHPNVPSGSARALITKNRAQNKPVTRMSGFKQSIKAPHD